MPKLVTSRHSPGIYRLLEFVRCLIHRVDSSSSSDQGEELGLKVESIEGDKGMCVLSVSPLCLKSSFRSLFRVQRSNQLIGIF
jgi:hypothetical protein